MDPLTMMLLSGGLGVAGNLFGLSKSSQANRKYDNYISGMTNKLDNWYNKESNTNYLDTEEAKAVLRRLQEEAKEISGDLESSAAVTGASAEKQVAMKDKLNKNYTGAATSLAGRGTQRKDNLRREYMGRQSMLDQLKLQSLLGKSQNWNQFGQNVSGTAQNAMLVGTMGGGGKIGSGATSGPGSMNTLPTENIFDYIKYLNNPTT